MGDQNIPLATFVLSYVGTRAGFALAKDYSRRNWSPEAASLVDSVARSSVMSPGVAGLARGAKPSDHRDGTGVSGGGLERYGLKSDSACFNENTSLQPSWAGQA